MYTKINEKKKQKKKTKKKTKKKKTEDQWSCTRSPEIWDMRLQQTMSKIGQGHLGVMIIQIL